MDGREEGSKKIRRGIFAKIKSARGKKKR